MQETPVQNGEARPAISRRGRRRNRPQQGGGAVYGLGMVGALVYFAGSADSPRGYAVAVGKAMVWPAILVYLALRRLGA
jgi:hypothetical protein